MCFVLDAPLQCDPGIWWPQLPLSSLRLALSSAKRLVLLSLRREGGRDNPSCEFISSPETFNRIFVCLGLSLPVGITGRCPGRSIVLKARKETPGILLPDVSASSSLRQPSDPETQPGFSWPGSGSGGGWENELNPSLVFGCTCP